MCLCVCVCVLRCVFMRIKYKLDYEGCLVFELGAYIQLTQPLEIQRNHLRKGKEQNNTKKQE